MGYARSTCAAFSDLFDELSNARNLLGRAADTVESFCAQQSQPGLDSSHLSPGSNLATFFNGIAGRFHHLPPGVDHLLVESTFAWHYALFDPLLRASCRTVFGGYHTGNPGCY